jgi:hypothetical protein
VPIPLQRHNQCKIRFLKDGVAYGFETEVMHVILSPYPMMFLKYPYDIEQVTIRKYNRIKLNLNARLLDSNGKLIEDAMITDISEGGCAVNIIGQDRRNLAVDKNYMIKFNILKTDLFLSCAIKKISSRKESCALGIEFNELSTKNKEIIVSFIEVLNNIFTYNTDMAITKLQTSVEGVSGHFGDLSLSDLLQLFDQSSKEGVLQISKGENSGSISVCKGTVMDATLDSSHGEDALLGIFSLQEAAFHFISQTVITGSIRKPISFVLLEVSRLMDEKEDLRDYLPGNDDKFTIRNDMEIDKDNPEIQAVINANRNGASSVDEIRQTSGLSGIRTVLNIAKLIKDGILIKSSTQVT